MSNLFKILSEYQENTRNAKVYRTGNGDWGVIVYDSKDDYNGFNSFVTEDDADNFAESWVLGNDTI